MIPAIKFHRFFLRFCFASVLWVVGLFLVMHPARGQAYDWAVDNTIAAAWGTAANWQPDTSFPNGVDVVANVYRDFSLTSGTGISLNAQPTVGTLKLGNTNTGLAAAHLIAFSGGSSAGRIDFQVSSGSALIDKLTANTATFRKRTNFNSNTIVSVTGGVLSWSRTGDTNNGSLGGNGNLSFEGSGGFALFDATANSGFATNYGGNITVRNGGSLVINNTLNAFTGGARSVTIANSGRLGGQGFVERNTVVQSGGRLAPGSSPGIVTFSEGLVLEAGSVFEFELTGNTTAGRGTAFDGVNVTGGNLLVESGASFDLIFNSGSTVDFTDAFWETNQNWLVFQNTNTITVAPGIFSIGSISNDSLGQSFNITGGSFSFTQDGNNIMLNYVIPEPSAWALLTFGAVLLFFQRRFKAKCVN